MTAYSPTTITPPEPVEWNVDGKPISITPLSFRDWERWNQHLRSAILDSAREVMERAKQPLDKNMIFNIAMNKAAKINILTSQAPDRTTMSLEEYKQAMATYDPELAFEVQTMIASPGSIVFVIWLGCRKNTRGFVTNSGEFTMDDAEWVATRCGVELMTMIMKLSQPDQGGDAGGAGEKKTADTAPQPATTG